jgi:acyl carrier protein
VATLDKVAAIAMVTSLLSELDRGGKPLPALTPESRLIGRDGLLDSIQLVTLIVSIEERVADDLGVPVTLVDEKAVSAKSSPFRSIDALADHVVATVAGARRG